jgi:tetratricopeptide (TPR) repeat protein
MLVMIAPACLLAESIQETYATANQFYNNQDYSKAIEYYQKLLALDPQNAGANIGLGNSYYQLGQKGKALTYYQKILALQPNNTQVSAMVANLKSHSEPTTMTFMVPSTESLPSQPGETKQQKTGINSENPDATSDPSLAGTKTFKRFELSLIGSLDIPNGSNQGLGFGGRICGGYRVDPSFSVLVSLAYLNASYSQLSTTTAGGVVQGTFSNSNNTSILECLGGFKYQLGSAPIHPYILVGLGIANLVTSSTNIQTSGGSISSYGSLGTNDISPVLEIGGGLVFPVGDDMNFFFQTQYQVILILSQTVTQSSYGSTYTNTTNNSLFTDLPIEIGLNFNL